MIGRKQQTLSPLYSKCMKRWIIFCLFASILFAHCSKEDATQLSQTPFAFNLPPGVDAPRVPADNAITLEKVALGKMLFFDPILSKDSTIACASCHVQSLAFVDDDRFSLGVDDSLGFRNALSLTNVAYNNLFFWDGGVPSLELQVIAPIESPFEMNHVLDSVVAKLGRHPYYSVRFEELFGRPVDKVSFTQSIASFERTLVSFNSPFDRYYFYNEPTLTEAQIRGKELFFGNRANCSNCHSLPNFTNNGFANNGLYETYSDMGRRRVTVRFNDDALFKTPTLRNIARTSPYMHDGSIPTLQAVVSHYNNGGSNHFNKSAMVRPLNLTPQEQADLVAFLESLTDDSFINNETFRP